MLPVVAAIAVGETVKILSADLAGVAIGHEVTKRKYKNELKEIQNRVEKISKESKRRRS